MPASTLPLVAKNRFCYGFLPGSSLSLSQGWTKQGHGQLHLCPILTRRIPTWLWLMPSCKWPVPMHTRSPCGTSSTVNAPSQHPGRFNPPYTYKHVPGCAYRRVVPASTLPLVAKNKFCVRLSTWVVPRPVPRANRPRATNSIYSCPRLPDRFLRSLALVDS